MIDMADRDSFKEVLIKENGYLSHCFELLANEEKVFIFGCSLAKDEHLIKQIFSEGSPEKDIYISYTNMRSKENIETKIKDRIGKHHITFVDCGGEQAKEVREKIWGIKEE